MSSRYVSLLCSFSLLSVNAALAQTNVEIKGICVRDVVHWSLLVHGVNFFYSQAGFWRGSWLSTHLEDGVHHASHGTLASSPPICPASAVEATNFLDVSSWAETHELQRLSALILFSSLLCGPPAMPSKPSRLAWANVRVGISCLSS